MMQIALTVLYAVLMTSLGLAQGQRPSPFGTAPPAQQPEPTEQTDVVQAPSGRRPLAAPAGRAADPFAEELAQSVQAEARWLSLHEAVMEELDSLPPCGDQAVRRIHEVRDAAFEMFTLRTNYLQKQLEYAGDVLKKAQESQTSLAVDRTELEASVRQIQQELEAARRREGELHSSIEAVGASANEAQSHVILDRLVAKLQEELRLARETLSEFDQTLDRWRAITRWARDRQRLALEQLDLVKAESRLWKAFYDGLSVRLALICYESKPPITTFSPRSPREVKP